MVCISYIAASVWLHWLIKACDLQQVHRICWNMAPDEIISYTLQFLILFVLFSDVPLFLSEGDEE